MAARRPAARPRAASARRAADTRAGSPPRGRGPPQHLRANRGGSRGDRVGTRGAGLRSRRARVRRHGTALRDEHEPQQHAARHPRASDLGADGPHARTVDDLRAFYRRELAPERSAKNTWLPDLNKDGSRDWRDLAQMKERLYRIQDTDGDGIADRSQIMIEGFNADPDVRRRRRGALQRRRSVPRRRARRLAAARQRRRLHRSQVVDQRGLQHAPGVRRTRHLGRDARPRRPDLLGSRRHGPRRRRSDRAAAGRIRIRAPCCAPIPTARTSKSLPPASAISRSSPSTSYGNLISVDNDGDHQGETERLVYMPDGSDSGWRSNWQYGKYTDPANNRYNVWMDEGMFKPRFAGQAAHIMPPIARVPRRSVGDGLQPGHRAVGRVAESLLRLELPGPPGSSAIYAFRLRGGRRRFRARRRQGAAAGHPDRRHEVRSRRRAVSGRLDHRLGLEEQGTDLEARLAAAAGERDAGRSADAPRRRTSTAAVPPISAAAAARRHARPSKGAVRAGAPRRREDAPRAASRARTPAGAHSWRLGRRRSSPGKDPQHAPLLAPFLADADAEIRAQAAKMIGDVRYGRRPARWCRCSRTPRRARGSSRPRRSAGSPTSRRRRRSCDAGRQRRPRRLPASRRQPGAVAHRRRRALAALSRHPSRGVRIAAIVALRRMRHPDVARFLDRRRRARRARGGARDQRRRWDRRGAAGAGAGARGGRFTSEPLLRRAISANLRVGTSEAMARLTTFAADASRPAGMRAEAAAGIACGARRRRSTASTERTPPERRSPLAAFTL